MVTLTELFTKDITSPDYNPTSGTIILDLIDFIKENCKPYLLKKNPKTWLQKGSHNHWLYKIQNIHTDRQPRDSSLTVHDFLNDVIEQAGATVNRSNCSFAAAYDTLKHGHSLMEYGNLYYVFPIGNFDITWSKWISDPYRVLDKNNHFFADIPNLRIFKDRDSNISFIDGRLPFTFPINDEMHNRKTIDKIIKTYNHGLDTLSTAMKMNHEIMIGSCEKILLIRKDGIGEKVIKNLKRLK
jgi:hypothetical protein